MIAKPKTVPDLRFPGRGEVWKNKNLGDLCKIRTGKLDANAASADGQYRFYTCAKSYLMIDDYAFDTEALLISGNGAGVGYVHYYHGKFNAYQRTYVLDGFSEAINFVQFQLETKLRKRIQLESKAGNIPYIVMDTLTGMRLSLPTLPEQRKIAEFLTAVDGRIGQLSQKKALLEDYKKGVMQQIFTQALRFKDDHGNDFPEWEEKKLGDLTKWASGGTPSKDNASFWEGDIPWMSAATMHERYYSDSPLRITEEGVKSGSKMAQKGTLLLLVRGSMLWNRIPVGITTRDVAFNQDVKSLSPASEISAEFLLQWFIASENMLLHKVVGTGIGAGKLDTDEMKSLPLQLPTPDEQTKIAHFLTALDRKIESVAQQIRHTQAFKKGLLQQMFA